MEVLGLSYQHFFLIINTRSGLAGTIKAYELFKEKKLLTENLNHLIEETTHSQHFRLLFIYFYFIIIIELPT